MADDIVEQNNIQTYYKYIFVIEPLTCGDRVISV